MKILTVLKRSINILFYLFIVVSIFWLTVPFFSGTEHYSSNQDILVSLILIPISHLIILFLILYNLRKFILNAKAATPLEEKTRAFLRRAGIFSLIYSLLAIPQFLGLLTFWFSQKNDSQLMTTMWECSWELSSSFYSFLIGLFFIYLSKVLEYSEKLEQENLLTI